MGSNYMRMGKFRKALENYEKSLEMRESHRMLETSKYERAWLHILQTLNSAAACYSNIGEFQKALDMYEKAWQSVIQHGIDHVEAAQLLNSIAFCYFGLKVSENKKSDNTLL